MRLSAIAAVALLVPLAAGCIQESEACGAPAVATGFPSPSPNFAPGMLRQGEVTVQPAGSGHRAERTDSADLQVHPAPAALILQTTNGDVEQQVGPHGHVEVSFWACGDTPDQARERLATMHVEFLAGERPGLELLAIARTTATGDDAWDHKGAHVRLTIPDVPVTTATLATVNGDVHWDGLAVSRLETRATNGDLDVTGRAATWMAYTVNGDVTAELSTPRESGRIEVVVTNGDVALALAAGRDHGLDVQARTVNGDVEVEVAGAEPVGETLPNYAAARTPGFASASLQTVIRLESTNGDVTAHVR